MAADHLPPRSHKTRDMGDDLVLSRYDEWTWETEDGRFRITWSDDEKNWVVYQRCPGRFSTLVEATDPLRLELTSAELVG